MKIEFKPFTNEMIPDAGKLLAGRQARNRQTLPLLPIRFEDPQIAAKAVESLWHRKQKNGYAAYRDQRMIAYLIGGTSTDPWGRSGYVYLPGYALAGDESPAVMQDLYAMLGEDWVKKGNFNHYLYVSAADKQVIDALFGIGFGKERTDALLDFKTLEIPEYTRPENVSIRQAGSGDNEHLGSLSDVIFRALAQAPYWHPTVPEDWDELREGWAELADDKDWTVWLAMDNDKTLGTIGFRPEDENDTQMLIAPKTVYLSVAATQPEARGRGINTALSWHGLAESHKSDYEICYTNWINPNLLASRFWPRFGFQDVAYRLAKKVNPMIVWARAK